MNDTMIRNGKNWVKLLRPFHYVKNLLVLFPMFFAGAIYDVNVAFCSLVGFLAFNALASAVYILNDLADIESDRVHPTKRYRPLASGAIGRGSALAACVLLFLLSLLFSCFAAAISGNWGSILFPITYFFTNIVYSRGLKDVPVLDVVLVASGFVIRLFYGGAIAGIEISDWLFLTVASTSLFLAFGKRRNEIRRSGSCARRVLDGYPLSFVTPIIYVFLTLSITFYSLWALQLPDSSHIVKYSIVLVMVIFAEYTRTIESDSDGDPAEVLKGSRSLPVLALLFGSLLFFALYLI